MRENLLTMKNNKSNKIRMFHQMRELRNRNQAKILTTHPITPQRRGSPRTVGTSDNRSCLGRKFQITREGL